MKYSILNIEITILNFLSGSLFGEDTSRKTAHSEALSELRLKNSALRSIQLKNATLSSRQMDMGVEKIFEVKFYSGTQLLLANLQYKTVSFRNSIVLLDYRLAKIRKSNKG